MDTLMALAPGLAVFQQSQTELLHTMDAGAHLALAFMQHLTSYLAAVLAEPAPMRAGCYTAAAESCIHLLGEWATHAVQDASSLQRPSNAAAAVSVLGFIYYAQSLLPDALTAQVGSLAHSSRISNSASSPGTVAVAAAAAAHVASRAREWPEQFGLLHWLKKAKQQQQQQQQQDALSDLAADAADPCFVVTGGVSMQAAAWVGSCNFGRLQRKFVDVIRAAAGVVQQRCWDEVSQLTGQQQQQQQPQGGIPWLTQLNSAPTLQPIKCLLLAQLLLCSVDRFCSNGAATLNMLAAYASQAAELAANAVSFTMAHQKGVQQDHFCLPRDWLVTVLPATLQLLAHAVQLLDKGRSNPAGSSNSSSGGSSSSKQREQQQEKAVVLRPLQLLLNVALLTCRPDPVATAAVRSGQDGSISGAVPGAESADPETGEALAPFPFYTAPAWKTHIAIGIHTLPSSAVQSSAECWRGCCVCWGGARRVTDFTAAVANMVSGLIIPPSGLSAVRLAFVGNFRAACPGCPTQLQVFSMLCSLLKVGSVVRQVDEAAADAVCWGTANVATLLGAESLAKVRVAAAAAASAAAAPSSTKPVEELHHVVRSPAQPSAAASEGLLWLVLAGPCCLQWAVALRQLQGRSDLEQLLIRLQQLEGEPDSVWDSALRVTLSELCAEACHAATAIFNGPHSLAASVLSTCLKWLQLQGNAEQLTAAGCPISEVLQQVQEVLAVLPEPVNAADAAAAVTAFDLLVQRLQRLGLAVNTLAVPHACNNPACTTFAGPTALVTVSGRSCVCAGCQVARYCSRGCQKQHWQQHKPVCRTLADGTAGDQARP